MPSSSAPVPLTRAYIDTNVFVCHFRKTGSFTQRADKFLKEIEDAKVHGITTTFVISEFVCVMLRAICARRGSFQRKDLDTIRLSIEDFIKKMGISLYDSDDLVLNIYGKSELFSKCERTIENLLCARKKYKATLISGVDVLHLVLAQNIGVDYYATFDEGFKGARNIVKVRVL